MNRNIELYEPLSAICMRGEKPYHEFVEHTDKLPFRTFLHRVNTCSPHYHSECEFLLVLKGELQIQCSDKTSRLREGDMFFIPSKVIHMTEGLTRDNIINVLQVDTKFLDDLYADFSSLDFSFNKVVRNPLAKAQIQHVREVIAGIAWEMRMRHPGYKLQSQSLLLELFSVFIRDFSIVTDSLSTDMELGSLDDIGDRLERIIAYLDRHSDNDIASSELAEKEGISVSYLARLFKNQFGVTFSNYLNNLRAQKSLSRLVKDDQTILDVALDSGFANLKSYNIVFKRCYGVTPSQWRKKNGGKVIFSVGESAYGRFDRNFAYSLLRRYLPMTMV